MSTYARALQPNQVPIGKAAEGQSSGAPTLKRCESALLEQGVDVAFVGKRLKNMLEAKHRRWNNATQSWETFEDYGTQLEAIREIAKLLGLYPTRKELEDEHKPHEVIVKVVYDEPKGPQSSS